MFNAYKLYQIEKCGNCKYWSGHRKLRSDGSPDLSSGTCTHKNSYSFGKKSNGFGSKCNFYERCYELQEIIRKEEEKTAKRENERLEQKRIRESNEQDYQKDGLYSNHQFLDEKTERKLSLLLPIVTSNRKMIGFLVGFSLLLMLIFLCVIRFINEYYLEYITGTSFEAYLDFYDSNIKWIIFGFSTIDVALFIFMSIKFEIYEIKFLTIVAYIASAIVLWLLSLLNNLILEEIEFISLALIIILFIFSIVIGILLLVAFKKENSKKKKFISENEDELQRLYDEENKKQ